MYLYSNMAIKKTKRNKKFAELSEKGISVRDIAKIHGLHWTTVHKAIQRENHTGHAGFHPRHEIVNSVGIKSGDNPSESA